MPKAARADETATMAERQVGCKLGYGRLRKLQVGITMWQNYGLYDVFGRFRQSLFDDFWGVILPLLLFLVVLAPHLWSRCRPSVPGRSGGCRGYALHTTPSWGAWSRWRPPATARPPRRWWASLKGASFYISNFKQVSIIGGNSWYFAAGVICKIPAAQKRTSRNLGSCLFAL